MTRFMRVALTDNYDTVIIVNWRGEVDLLTCKIRGRAANWSSVTVAVCSGLGLVEINHANVPKP